MVVWYNWLHGIHAIMCNRNYCNWVKCPIPDIRVVAKCIKCRLIIAIFLVKRVDFTLGPGPGETKTHPRLGHPRLGPGPERTSQVLDRWIGSTRTWVDFTENHGSYGESYKCMELPVLLWPQTRQDIEAWKFPHCMSKEWVIVNIVCHDSKTVNSQWNNHYHHIAVCVPTVPAHTNI
jgi:hypothetical protein